MGNNNPTIKLKPNEPKDVPVEGKVIVLSHLQGLPETIGHCHITISRSNFGGLIRIFYGITPDQGNSIVLRMTDNNGNAVEEKTIPLLNSEGLICKDLKIEMEVTQNLVDQKELQADLFIRWE